MSVRQEQTTGTTMAEQADIHELYELSVQAVDAEVEFLDATFRQLRGRSAASFREDFCGTASAACEWVRSAAGRTAVGVDNWPEVLDWGRANRLSKLSAEQRGRVTLLLDDVRTVSADKVDIVGAFNFSYFLFKERGLLRDYFASVHAGLREDGLFFLDAFGGSEAITVQKEKTRHKKHGFTYIWDQAVYEPVTGRMLCHIHFKFRDGSRIKRAFTYDWRLWTLPEIYELLLEAGFSKVRVYWEGADDDGECNGVYTESRTGEPDPAWVSYIVAEP